MHCSLPLHQLHSMWWSLPPVVPRFFKLWDSPDPLHPKWPLQCEWAQTIKVTSFPPPPSPPGFCNTFLYVSLEIGQSITWIQDFCPYMAILSPIYDHVMCHVTWCSCSCQHPMSIYGNDVTQYCVFNVGLIRTDHVTDAGHSWVLMEYPYMAIKLVRVG